MVRPVLIKEMWLFKKGSEQTKRKDKIRIFNTY